MNIESLREKLSAVNKTQILGLFFIAVAGFAYFGGLSWAVSFENRSLVETYRGYEIYYFPDYNVYGIDTGGEAEDWPFQTSESGAEGKIDFWLDGPVYVEAYRDFEVYKLNGVTFYYAEGLGDKTNTYDDVDNLRSFIDVEYYGIEVYRVEYEGVTWTIMQLGYFDPVFYGVNGDEETPDFSSVDEAYQYLVDMLQEYAGEDVEPSEEEVDDPVSEDENPIPEDTGENEGTVETIGDKLEAKRLIITGVSGTLGVGLLIFGSVRREED